MLDEFEKLSEFEISSEKNKKTLKPKLKLKTLSRTWIYGKNTK